MTDTTFTYPIKRGDAEFEAAIRAIEPGDIVTAVFRDGANPAFKPGTMTGEAYRDDALTLLWQYGRTERDAGATTGLPGATDLPTLARYHRTARAAAHPDRNNGSQTAWDQVEQAAKVLGVLA